MRQNDRKIQSKTSVWIRLGWDFRKSSNVSMIALSILRGSLSSALLFELVILKTIEAICCAMWFNSSFNAFVVRPSKAHDYYKVYH